MISFNDLLKLAETTKDIDRFLSSFPYYDSISKHQIGDKTDGVMNDEVLKRLLNAQEIIMHKNLDISRSDDDEFNIGDIVYYSTSKEHGIVLGEKPSSSIETLVNDVSSIRLGTKRKHSKTYVILTVYFTESNLNDGKNIHDYDFRIRYANSNNLKLYQKYDYDSKTVRDDLEAYCNKQCIMECSEDCYIYKYVKNKK